MYMKITRFARGANWGGFAVSRLLDSAAAARVHRSARARKPKPQEAVLSNWRRETRGAKAAGSVDIAELSGSKQRLADARPGRLLWVSFVAGCFEGAAIFRQVS